MTSKRNCILARELSKEFGGLQVLNKVSFEAAEGEFLCFVGPSGCGKTTLLKIVAGLNSPSSGSMLIHGESPNPAKQSIGFVFQESSLYPWRNVYDNIKFGLELRKESKNLDQRVNEMIQLVGLSSFQKYYPHQISGGMGKRVAIARSLAVNPSVLLMDEPFGDLDAQTRWIMHRELWSIHEKLRKTTLFVTHNVEEAVYLADRIMVLTKRPTSIKKVISIDLERPRYELSEQFVKYREKILQLLREEVPQI
jgi:NitT/TauT family transport system ATP-binding protein